MSRRIRLNEPAALDPDALPLTEPAPAEPAPRWLRVLEPLENPAGGIWEPGAIIPFDALQPESITILMTRQIVIVHLDADALAALPLVD